MQYRQALLKAYSVILIRVADQDNIHLAACCLRDNDTPVVPTSYDIYALSPFAGKTTLYIYLRYPVSNNLYKEFIPIALPNWPYDISDVSDYKDITDILIDYVKEISNRIKRIDLGKRKTPE